MPELSEEQQKQCRLAGIVETRDDTKQVTLRVRENLHRDFKIRCVFEGNSMGSVIERLIKKYIESQGAL